MQRTLDKHFTSIYIRNFQQDSSIYDIGNVSHMLINNKEKETVRRKKWKKYR